MASLITHGAVSVLVGRAVVLPVKSRRFWMLAILCACLPDIDVAGFAFGIQYGDFFGHRGFTHSLAFAALLALAVLLLAFRELKPGTRTWWLTLAFFFGVGASHGLLDAMTNGGLGVAFFSPFENSRYFLPFRPLQVSPLGVQEFVGRWGLFVLLNELLVVVAPTFLVVGALGIVRLRPGVRGRALVLLVTTTVVWLVLFVTFMGHFPALFASPPPRPLKSFGARGSDDDPARIPREDLPGGRLVSRFEELAALGAFDRDLRLPSSPWSSSFFPSWYGGAAGRWQDPRPVLLWRTLTGFELPARDAALELLRSAAGGDRAAQERLFRLSPTEKYDLSVGDYSFAASRHALEQTHNRSPHPRFWFGLCNGVAAAALATAEPYRVVEATNPDGFVVRFHPNDVKALLALSYYETASLELLGGACGVISFDAGAVCSMNPGSLVLAILNRIGIAKRSFLVDVHPSVQMQQYPVAGARVAVLRAPYPAGTAADGTDLAGRAATLVDVAIRLDVSSTELDYAAADRLDGAEAGGTYRKVGAREVSFTYPATLALDAEGEIVGGRWNGTGDGPDFVAFPAGGPRLNDDRTVSDYPYLRWPIIEQLYAGSIDDGVVRTRLDVRRLCGAAPCPVVVASTHR
jgi:inner membrane protein